MALRTFFLLTIVLLSTSVQQVNAQSESVRWMDFEALEVALTKETKKVFVDFVTEWCVYCKKNG
jgi:thiol:disulfide interchange protein